MKWHKQLLLTVSGIIILFTVSLCLLNNTYDQRLWEEIVFLKPNGDDKPRIILVLFFVLIAQMIQNYVHMGRCARKELSILIAGKIDKRKWLIEKNKEMYMRGLLLAERLSLAQDLDKKYRLYSMGMQQKQRVIQALMEHPRYLILDEIFDALDDQSKQTVQDLLDEYLKDHAERYVIYTSHEDRMDRFADRTLMIKDAKIVEISE